MNRPRTAILVRGLIPGLALVAVLVSCGRQAVQAPPVLASSVTVAAPAVPWTWYPLGGLAVVEGEVTEPTQLVLEGRSIRETRYAETGPVRWEFFRPPPDETAVLRTAEGRELARFEFSLTPARTPAPVAQPARPRPLRLAKQAPPAPPAREAASPQSVARLEPTPVPPLTGRKAGGLPHAQPSEPTRPEPAAPESARTWTLVHPGGTPTPPLTGRRPVTLPLSPDLEPAPKAASRTAVPRLALPISPGTNTPGINLAPWPGMGEALNLTRGPGGQRRLLLSFDGGSSSEVAAEILDALKARGVRTTLFLTGAFIQRYPALVKRMAAEGHELGNHTMHHPHFAPGMKRDPQWTRERVQKELLEADAALVRLLGRPMDPFWRAPYGEHTAEIRRWAEELGYRHVGWSEGADTLDWATPKERRLYRSGDAILQRLQQRLNRDGDGLIVLMHLGSGRAEADRPSAGLGAFMDRARNEGWTFVPVSAYLRDLGKPTWNPQQRLSLLQAPGSAVPAR
ncbi:polysaccharide deacetylase family protein [Geothrix sp.]|jgi:peptidoglycan/xylan/chitin deacetylase (PgdA/CDA1 family)|uniref:polysaccharide deacetylase family protein n=1 Tax=Geothrix sp. TaxID=1962974 RepID=UPI0025B86637|nr:polysaccharide deacetylase family protein [Geothrix sp.]